MFVAANVKSVQSDVNVKLFKVNNKNTINKKNCI